MKLGCISKGWEAPPPLRGGAHPGTGQPSDLSENEDKSGREIKTIFFLYFVSKGTVQTTGNKGEYVKLTSFQKL